jgi:RHS repeat-associated protein
MDTTKTNAFNAGNDTSAVIYAYGPFGEVIRMTGPMAKLNPIRFSTKYDDDESDLLYYGYRYYNPSTGKWLSRDPLFEIAIATPLYFNSFAATQDENWLLARWERLLTQEETWLTEAEFIVEGQMISENPQTTVMRAAANLYAFSRNNPESYFDPTGLDATSYVADDFLGHASITINGKGYGFGPVGHPVVGALWTTGTTSGWGFTPTPREATTYSLRLSSSWKFGDARGGLCSCNATWGRVQECADYFEKTWNGTRYQFPSRTCRTYVNTIVNKCCLKAEKQTHEP